MAARGMTRTRRRMRCVVGSSLAKLRVSALGPRLPRGRRTDRVYALRLIRQTEFAGLRPERTRAFKGDT